MCARPDLHHPRNGLDRRQAGKPRAVRRRGKDPETPASNASSLQENLYPQTLAACLARINEFLKFFLDPDNRVSNFKVEQI